MQSVNNVDIVALVGVSLQLKARLSDSLIAAGSVNTTSADPSKFERRDSREAIIVGV